MNKIVGKINYVLQNLIFLKISAFYFSVSILYTFDTIIGEPLCYVFYFQVKSFKPII